MHDAGLDLSRDVHDVEREQLAGYAREGHVHVDFHFLAAALVDHELRVDDNAPVVGPLAPCQPKDEEQRGDGHNAAGGCSYASIFDGFGESIELCEARFGGHC